MGSTGQQASTGVFEVFGVFGVFGVFFLDQLDFKEGAELRSWLRSTEIEERVQADTLEVMFLKR